jgi:hypothetical protein
MSIGFKGVASSSLNLYGQMTGNAMRSGLVWVNSNGNDGPTPYIPNMYGASPDVIATGNSDARPLPYPRTTIGATGETLIGGSYGTAFPASLLGSRCHMKPGRKAGLFYRGDGTYRTDRTYETGSRMTPRDRLQSAAEEIE